MSKAKANAQMVTEESKPAKKKNQKKDSESKIFSFFAICIFAIGLIFISLEKSRSTYLAYKEVKLSESAKAYHEQSSNELARAITQSNGSKLAASEYDENESYMEYN